MIKAEVIVDFTLGRFKELKNIQRKNPSNNQEGYLYEGDTFECEEELGKYLTGENAIKKTVIRVLSVTPKEELKVEPKIEPKKKTAKKRK